MSCPKVLIATGGTGGHIFPAQALATELLEKNTELLFAGGGPPRTVILTGAGFLTGRSPAPLRSRETPLNLSTGSEKGSSKASSSSMRFNLSLSLGSGVFIRFQCSPQQGGERSRLFYLSRMRSLEKSTGWSLNGASFGRSIFRSRKNRLPATSSKSKCRSEREKN